MKEREIQFLFNFQIPCNNMIQLRDGKLLFYYTKGLSDIYICNEKTFQILYAINMHKIFNSFKKEKFKAKNKKEVYNFENEKNDDNNYFLNKFTDCKNCIKELKNDLILIGINKYLIKPKPVEKFLDYGISKKFDNIIENSIEISFNNNLNI